MAEADVVAQGVLQEARRAVRNAVKLSGSLLATWGIGLAIRFILPRHLGPELYGQYNFADSFAATFAVLLSLGLETYIRKELATRPQLASGFFGGVQLLRAAGLLVILAIMGAVLVVTGRPPQLIAVALLFAVAQYFVSANATLSAMLHASGHVGGMAALSVASKILWGAIIAAGLLLGTSLLPFVLALLVSEALECGALFALAARHLGLRLRIDRAGASAALLASLPFFVGNAAAAAYSKLDQTVLAFSAPASEVGYYGAASGIASIGMLVAPLVGWVVTPALSRAAARSTAELDQLMRRVLEVVMAAVFPCVLLLGLGADFWVRLILGPAFAPSAPALAIVSIALVMTYLGTLGATFLVILGRNWLITTSMGLGLCLNAGLNLLLIPLAMARLQRPGAGGVGCAIALVLAETLTSGTLLWGVGRRAWDLRLGVTLVKAAAICGVVIACDRLSAAFLPQLGWWRLGLDAALYALLALALGVLRVPELLALLRREEPAA